MMTLILIQEEEINVMIDQGLNIISTTNLLIVTTITIDKRATMIKEITRVVRWQIITLTICIIMYHLGNRVMKLETLTEITIIEMILTIRIGMTLTVEIRMIIITEIIGTQAVSEIEILTIEMITRGPLMVTIIEEAQVICTIII